MTLCEIALLWPEQPEGTNVMNSEGATFKIDSEGYIITRRRWEDGLSLIKRSDLTDDTWEFVPPPLWARKFGRVSE